MLELPEAVVIADQVNSTLQGKRIARAVANQSPHAFAWYSGDPAEYNSKLSGKVIGNAKAYGGYIEIATGEMGEMILGISAALRYYPKGAKMPPKHQLLLQFDDQTAVVATVQMWGGLFCLPAGEPGGFADYALARSRPSPLEEGFDRGFFDGLCGEDTGKLSAKGFLATGQRIPGLGNGVLQDILWTARIHPKRKMATLDTVELDGLFAATKSVLLKMTMAGGRDTERDLFGRPGGYRTVLSKKTLGKPCPECGTPIRKEPYLGGAIYYCAGCQRL